MIEVITKEDWKTSKWSGGETNEIYIYPHDGSYSDRDFVARISVANTDEEAMSSFTNLPGVNRFISVLDGQMHLIFEGRYEKTLRQYEIENFEGDWLTNSIGKYTDFNFMIKGGSGELSFRSINQNTILEIENDAVKSFIFVVEGSVTVEGNKAEKYDLIITDQKQLNLCSECASFYFGYFKAI